MKRIFGFLILILLLMPVNIADVAAKELHHAFSVRNFGYDVAEIQLRIYGRKRKQKYLMPAPRQLFDCGVEHCRIVAYGCKRYMRFVWT